MKAMLLHHIAPIDAAPLDLTELPIPERLTAMLSDGTLVAQGDNYLTAYSAGGKKLFSIPAGSVRLEHEVYFPGTSPAAGACAKGFGAHAASVAANIAAITIDARMNRPRVTCRK